LTAKLSDLGNDRTICLHWAEVHLVG